jgi:hypothetical protein
VWYLWIIIPILFHERMNVNTLCLVRWYLWQIVDDASLPCRCSWLEYIMTRRCNGGWYAGQLITNWLVKRTFMGRRKPWTFEVGMWVYGYGPTSVEKSLWSIVKDLPPSPTYDTFNCYKTFSFYKLQFNKINPYLSTDKFVYLHWVTIFFYLVLKYSEFFSV